MPKRIDRKFVSLESISHHLFCAICQEVFHKPTRAGCGHTFCWSCINKWSYQNKSCPHCRNTIKQKKLKPDLIPMKIIDDLEVFCSTDDCLWKGRLEVLSQHLKSCDFYKEKKNSIPAWLAASDKTSVEIIEIVDEPVVISDSESNIRFFFDDASSPEQIRRGSRQDLPIRFVWEASLGDNNNFLTVDTSSMSPSDSIENREEYLEDHKRDDLRRPAQNSKPNTRRSARLGESQSLNEENKVEMRSKRINKCYHIPRDKNGTEFRAQNVKRPRNSLQAANRENLRKKVKTDF